MKNITKTADLSEYTDEQIKIMFQSAEMLSILKEFVDLIKSGRFDLDGSNRISKKDHVLAVLKMICENKKIDPKLFDL